ncbi:hypothetical protein OsJ_09859 [Oryza sativa Japonica Group]|uniref:Uncharacterized protein n=1 Tax=Oryza sativa subsp. japonica TaxID=39947 RepID=B9F639_ORYSJ|nr:hypothetical protein OsJ_09859 [Oryza sativa Japonica Group]
MPPKPERRLFQYVSKPRRPAREPAPAPEVCGGGGEEVVASDADADAVYRMVTAAPTPSAMESALSASGVAISAPLLDLVLRRFRFAHGDPLRALSLLSLALDRHGVAPSPFALDTALYVLGRARRFAHMWDLLRSSRRLVPDAVTPRTAMVVLGRVAKVCSVRETVDSFRRLSRMLRGRGDDQEGQLFNALLRTLCQEKSMSDARNVYHALKYEFKVNRQTFNILLSGWKSAEDAEAFVAEMRELGVEPDLVTYNSLIDCHCKNRGVENAYKLLDEMREKDISPDVITYTSLIGGLGLIGQPDKAKHLLKEMHELGCYPDVPAYNTAIRNFVIAKRLGDAFALMEEMASKGLMPNATTYNLFFRCYYWAYDIGSAWQLYERMRSEGCFPNTQSCMFIVRLCHRHGRVAQALELWSDMVNNGFGSFTLVSDVLFDLLCDEGKLDEAERCFHQMIELGQKPSNVAFRRIKILMQLANREESIARLTAQMAQFGREITEKESSVLRYVVQAEDEVGGQDGGRGGGCGGGGGGIPTAWRARPSPPLRPKPPPKVRVSRTQVKLRGSPDAGQASREPGAAGPSREPDVAGPSREPDAAGPSREPGAAGGSREPGAAGGSRQPVPDAAQLAVVPYVEDIDRYLRSLEAEQTRRPMINYVQEIQGGIINMDVRGILVDWMADVAYVFNLQEETLHHAVSYVDRFLSKIAFPGDKLKLLGTTALFVASKYEEIHPPHVRNFSAVTVNTYTTQQVSKMELDILRFLNFDVGSPTVITFLRKFLTSCCGGNNSSNRKLELMCNYLAELSLLDDYYIRFLPSIVAAACLFVGKFTLNPNTRPWFGSVSTITPPENIKVCFLKDLKYANS